MAKLLFITLLILVVASANSGEAREVREQNLAKTDDPNIVMIPATVEVILLEADHKPVYLYGKLTVSMNGAFESLEDILFDRSSISPADVPVGDQIPLTRNEFSVLFKSSLKFQASLYGKDNVMWNEIAMGSAEFEVQASGTTHKVIEGNHGKIKVKITWGHVLN